MSRRHTAVTDPAEQDAGECRLIDVLRLIGDKWSTQILVRLDAGAAMRFTELERAVDGISRKMLTVSLRTLERNGLITRTAHAGSPPRVEYAATPAVEEIREHLEGLAAWAARSRPVIAEARRAYDARVG